MNAKKTWQLPVILKSYTEEEIRQLISNRDLLAYGASFSTDSPPWGLDSSTWVDGGVFKSDVIVYTDSGCTAWVDGGAFSSNVCPP